MQHINKRKIGGYGLIYLLLLEHDADGQYICINEKLNMLKRGIRLPVCSELFD